MNMIVNEVGLALRFLPFRITFASTGYGPTFPAHRSKHFHHGVVSRFPCFRLPKQLYGDGSSNCMVAASQNVLWFENVLRWWLIKLSFLLYLGEKYLVQTTSIVLLLSLLDHAVFPCTQPNVSLKLKYFSTWRGISIPDLFVSMLQMKIKDQ